MADYERLRPVTPEAGVVLQDNAGPMTLDGTNTWVLRAPGAATSVVVDPGQAGDAHLAAVLAAAGEVELIVVTHRHVDHSEAAPALHEASGAPVFALDPTLCLGKDSVVLEDEMVVTAGGVDLRVLATPGHTSDSVSLVIDGGPVMTGDMILGRGTTVVTYPDGDLAAYLKSIARLRDLGDVLALPGHGPALPSVRTVAEYYLKHRAERLDQVRQALHTLGPTATARSIVEHVYADVDKLVWDAAEQSVMAQLEYLRDAP